MSRSLTTLAVALVFTSIGAAPAVAGTYSLNVCGKGPNKSWAPAATDGMLASPAPRSCAGGLTARHKVGPAGSKVPSGSAARFIFKAPAGTSIDVVYLTGRFDTRGTKWQAVLSNGRKVLAGCPGGQESCTKTFDNQAIQVPNSDKLYIEALCTRGPCNASRHPDAGADHVNARARIRAASVLIKDNTPPALVNGAGSAWTSAWINGKRAVTFDALDGSGIIGVHALVDGVIVNQTSRACGVYAYTCRDWRKAALDVDVSRINDGQHLLTVAATDRASNVGVAEQQLNVDNTPPTPPVNVTSNLPRGWTSTPTVHLAWANPAQQFAPIAAATVRACPAGQGGGCSTRDYEGADLSQVDYDLPGEGAWDVQVWLRDAAGNSSPAQASPGLRLGLDRILQETSASGRWSE